jgi:hypothetical protein
MWAVDAGPFEAALQPNNPTSSANFIQICAEKSSINQNLNKSSNLLEKEKRHV